MSSATSFALSLNVVSSKLPNGWGTTAKGNSGIPPILDDGTVNTVRNWFPLDPETGAEYPIIIFINAPNPIEIFYFTTL